MGPVEHPGRVRGLGLGARPSMVYGKSAASEAGPSSSSRRSTTDDQVQDIVAQQVAQQMAQQKEEMAQQMEHRVEQRTRVIQEQAERWFAQHRASWEAVTGALIDLCPGRQFPPPPPPPTFSFDSPTPPRPPPFDIDETVVSSARADPRPPETGPDDQAPGS